MSSKPKESGSRKKSSQMSKNKRPSKLGIFFHIIFNVRDIDKMRFNERL